MSVAQTSNSTTINQCVRVGTDVQIEHGAIIITAIGVVRGVNVTILMRFVSIAEIASPTHIVSVRIVISIRSDTGSHRIVSLRELTILRLRVLRRAVALTILLDDSKSRILRSDFSRQFALPFLTIRMVHFLRVRDIRIIPSPIVFSRCECAKIVHPDQFLRSRMSLGIRTTLNILDFECLRPNPRARRCPDFTII